MYFDKEKLKHLIADKNLRTGRENAIKDEWIKFTEEKLNFELPISYKWFLKNFEYLSFNSEDNLKIIAPPEFRDTANDDILYFYNLEEKHCERLTILERFDGDEIYYFDIQNSKNNNEFNVYKIDYYSNSNELFADNFLEFLEKIISEYQFSQPKVNSRKPLTSQFSIHY